MTKALSEVEKKIITDVNKHGWQAMHVFDPDGNDPNFTYSIGFTKSLNAPEFIIFGFSRDLMHSMLWGIYDQIKNGAIPTDGMVWRDLLEGFDCISKKASHKQLFTEYTTSANWLWKLNGNQGFPDIYQMVWPGAKQGLFPWDEGCAQETIDMQTPLWIES